ncbi:hypothetical protein [Flavobacterium sp.]|uniref:hypothetical protein n=1 Tax=Flavobacterium sp. TaxID=239 RepID=UPI003D1152E6
MKLKSHTTISRYLKQLLLVLALIYAFSNCHVKKSVLHFAGIDIVELSQKSLTQLPVQGSCTVNLIQKNHLSKKSLSTPETPVFPKLQSFNFQLKKNIAFTTFQIHPAFEFDKSSIHYPALFIVFKNLKIAPRIVSYFA